MAVDPSRPKTRVIVEGMLESLGGAGVSIDLTFSHVYLELMDKHLTAALEDFWRGEFDRLADGYRLGMAKNRVALDYLVSLGKRLDLLVAFDLEDELAGMM